MACAAGNEQGRDRQHGNLFSIRGLIASWALARCGMDERERYR